jgi:hypothetical protein
VFLVKKKKGLKNEFLGKKTINLNFSTTIIAEIRGKQATHCLTLLFFKDF